jgi:predicted transcriptional regulator
VRYISFRDIALRNRPNTGFGHLESEVIELLQQSGAGTVREIQNRMSRKLAYTTVMTTLDRLYKKGFLVRAKCSRSFRYTVAPTHWRTSDEGADRTLTEQLHLLADPQLISCLIDIMAAKDVALLEQLEQMAAARRMELNRKGTD